MEILDTVLAAQSASAIAQAADLGRLGDMGSIRNLIIDQESERLRDMGRIRIPNLIDHQF